MAEPASATDRKSVLVLWAAFAIQVLGRLLDLRWHQTHSEFETAADQVQAHWLGWLGTVLVLAATMTALIRARSGPARPGYLTVLVSNGLYAVTAVVHFVQHANRSEVDLTHAMLGVTNIAAVVGVLMVTIAYLRGRHSAPSAG